MSKISLNPELSEGDRIVLLRMGNDPNPVSPLSRGTVIRISEVFGGLIYNIKWDDGSSLSVIPEEDTWVFEEDYESRKSSKNLNESVNNKKFLDFVMKNKDLFKNINTRRFRLYLSAIRDTSIVNMFQASYFLICGKERLQHFVKYMNVRNKKALKYVIDNADEVRDEMIRASINSLERKNKEISTRSVETEMNKISNELLQVYIRFPIMDTEKEYENIELDDDDYGYDEDDYNDDWEDEEEDDDDY
jgi:hypothetical protein